MTAPSLDVALERLKEIAMSVSQRQLTSFIEVRPLSDGTEGCRDSMMGESGGRAA